MAASGDCASAEGLSSAEREETGDASDQEESACPATSSEPEASTALVNLRLFPGNSVRRREFALDTTLWQIKQHCERELRTPALVVAVTPTSSRPSAPLPWNTSLRDVGFESLGCGDLAVYLLRKAEDDERGVASLESLGVPECLTDATAGTHTLHSLSAAKPETLTR